MPSAHCGPDADEVGGVEQAAILLAHLGPELTVHIGFDPAFDPEAPAHEVPNLPEVPYKALIDTGASLASIDSSLATQQNLPAVDRTHIGGVGGVHEVNMYLAQIHIPSLKFTLYGEFAGVHLAEAGVRQQALLGRNFLYRFAMHYEGRTGMVVLSNESGPDLLGD